MDEQGTLPEEPEQGEVGHPPEPPIDTTTQVWRTSRLVVLMYDRDEQIGHYEYTGTRIGSVHTASGTDQLSQASLQFSFMDVRRLV